MLRLRQEELGNITKFVAEGQSLKQIARSINKSKTTVYYHFRKIKGKTVHPIIVNPENDEFVGEFMGLFAGDGCMDVTKDFNYRVYLCFSYKTEQRLANNIIDELLIPLFGKKPMIFTRWTSNYNLCYYSKAIHQFICEYLIWDESSRKTYSVRLMTRNHSLNFMIGFIRGSIDSDGHISKNKISFASVSRQLIEDISCFLSKISIAHSIHTYKEKRISRKDIHHITVFWKDRERFLTLVKPRKIKACVGRDSNYRMSVN